MLTFFLLRLLGSVRSSAFASTLSKVFQPSASSGPMVDEVDLALHATSASPNRSKRPSDDTRRRGSTLSAVDATSVKRTSVDGDELAGRAGSWRKNELSSSSVEGGRGADELDAEVGRSSFRSDQCEADSSGPDELRPRRSGRRRAVGQLKFSSLTLVDLR